MRARLVIALSALALLPGCHRITGYAENTYSDGTIRHLAGLDLAYRAVIVLAVGALFAGAYLVVAHMLKPDRRDASRLFWGVALLLIAGVFAARMYLDFGIIDSCC